MLASCASTQNDDQQTIVDTAQAAADRNNVEISEITSLPDNSTVTVTGFLIEDSGVVYLAEMLAESFPPQPGGTTVMITGLDDDALSAASTEGPIRWYDTSVTLEATVREGALTDAAIVE